MAIHDKGRKRSIGDMGIWLIEGGSKVIGVAWKRQREDGSKGKAVMRGCNTLYSAKKSGGDEG